jgi:hypothetical protein
LTLKGTRAPAHEGKNGVGTKSQMKRRDRIRITPKAGEKKRRTN